MTKIVSNRIWYAIQSISKVTFDLSVCRVDESIFYKKWLIVKICKFYVSTNKVGIGLNCVMSLKTAYWPMNLPGLVICCNMRTRS